MCWPNLGVGSYSRKTIRALLRIASKQNRRKFDEWEKNCEGNYLTSKLLWPPHKWIQDHNYWCSLTIIRQLHICDYISTPSGYPKTAMLTYIEVWLLLSKYRHEAISLHNRIPSKFKLLSCHLKIVKLVSPLCIR